MRTVAACLFVFMSFALLACTSSDRREDILEAHRIAQHITSHMNAEFTSVRLEVARLAQATQSAYANKDDILESVNTDNYQLAENGVFYKTVADGHPALFVSAIQPITREIKEVAYLTEGIDSVLEEIPRKFPEVVQAYYNDRNSLNRIYPPFDVLSQYEPRIDIPSFNFYYLADEAHNPDKAPLWVAEPYVDPAGRGWVVSAIAPVYVQGNLEGVCGLDVSISTVTDRYIPETDTLTLLVDGDGVVVTGHENAIGLLSLPPLSAHKYMTTIKQDTYRREDYSLLKSRSRNVRAMAENLLNEDNNQGELTVRGRNYTVVSARISELGWTVLRIVE